MYQKVRVRKERNWVVYFDVNRFENVMRNVLKKTTSDIQTMLFRKIKFNVSELEMKHNPVKMASGETTSDAERKEDLSMSVRKQGHIRTQGQIGETVEKMVGKKIKEFTEYKGNMVIKASVSAMASNFKDSHIGWYYELGTGEESDPKGYAKYGLNDLVSVGHENPYRLPNVGSPIVSRSKKHGTWMDLGGNLRKTGSNIGGIGNPNIPDAMDPIRYYELLDNFRKYIGPDIEAQYWFERAVEESREAMFHMYKQAVSSLDILNPSYGILQVRKKLILDGKERW